MTTCAEPRSGGDDGGRHEKDHGHDSPAADQTTALFRSASSSALLEIDHYLRSPPLPSLQVKHEARFIFRELLSNRGLLRHTSKPDAGKTTPAAPIPAAPTPPSLPTSTSKRALSITHTRGSFDATPIGFVLLGGLCLLGAGAAYRRRGSEAAATLEQQLAAADEINTFPA